MAIKIKNTLARFIDRLEKNKNIDGNKIAHRFGEEGKKILNFEYSQSIGSGLITVDTQYENNGKAEIIASGDKVAYIEFGVGEYAKGTYQGELPTQPITFESPEGKTHTTQGWEYYYPNKDTKVSYGGQHGWMLNNGKFETGHVAGNQMFYTMKSLEDNKKQIVKDAIKGD